MERVGEQTKECRSTTSTPRSVDTREQLPDVYRATWKLEDHVAELESILQGVTADQVENRLVQYVENSIEPTGWRAIWRPSSDLSESVLNFQKPSDIYVDVINVSREKLLAEVKILKPVENDLAADDLKLIEENKNTQIMVPLMELYPLVEQENDVLDIATTTEVVDQIRFFYKNVWRAWDLEEEKCCYDYYLINSRLKLYRDIDSGIIPASVASELRSLVKQANFMQQEIKKIEAKSEWEGLDGEVDELDVARLIQLHKDLEQLKVRFEMLQDPVFREVLIHQQQVERCEIVSLDGGASTAKVKLVANSLTVTALACHMAKLPSIIKSLPQVPEDAACQTFPTLQLALDMAVQGDVVVVLPGNHSLIHLGLISVGGTLIGLGKGVNIKGGEEAGDILMDTSGNFTMKNITLQPSRGQVGIVHHDGILTLHDVTIEGGTGGFVGLGKTELQVNQVTVRGSSAIGMDFREGAKASVSSCIVVDCTIGIQMEQEAKVSLSATNIKENKECGVVVVWPVAADTSRLNNIPKQALLEYLLEECVGNDVRNNKIDVYVVGPLEKQVQEASSIPTTDSSDQASHTSSDSMDSG
ncbi:protein nessun dorma isoform X2 [Cherax quadricarinatus]|nr:protein nessun dorma-like isoform X2 [Cherax quadricarinatus]